MTNRIVAVAAAAALTAPALTTLAAPVEVTIRGVVESNVIRGSHQVVQTNDPVVTTFRVDTNNFVDSPGFPTRGYAIDLATFSMTVGGAAVSIADPQPFGPAYFILRNNDPAVDGFFISRNIDVPQPITVNIPGLTADHEFDFLVSYPDTTIPSLDIADAAGDYDFTGISLFNWTIGRFGNPGALYTYETMTIEVIPAPATLLVAPLFLIRRRRHR